MTLAEWQKEPLKGRFDAVEHKWTPDPSLTLPDWHPGRVGKIFLVHVFLFSHPLDLSQGLCSITYRARGRHYTFACGNFSKSWGICWVQCVSYLDAFNMGLTREFVTIASASELLKEPHSLPTAQAAAAEGAPTPSRRSDLLQRRLSRIRNWEGLQFIQTSVSLENQILDFI